MKGQEREKRTRALVAWKEERKEKNDHSSNSLKRRDKIEEIRTKAIGGQEEDRKRERKTKVIAIWRKERKKKKDQGSNNLKKEEERKDQNK